MSTICTNSAAGAKNPKRVAAGRRNRLKRGPLTDQGRERLRATAMKHEPWRFSTGPRTDAGKQRAAANGRKRGVNPASLRQLRLRVAGASNLAGYMAALRRSVEKSR